MHQLAAPPVVLTIAGFDPTCGAGIAADLKTFAANHCYGVAAITALTVQNTQEARGYSAVAGPVLGEQLACLLEDVPPAAVKIGMLANAELVEVVAAALERARPSWIVLDPVLAATSGAPLIDAAGLTAMRERLLPLVSMVTPNLEEATRLTGLAVGNEMQMAEAAAALLALGAQTAVITGGHLDKPVDVFCDGARPVALGGDRVRTQHTHGTGCTFSAAVAANLALGKGPLDAVVQAKAYVGVALRNAYGIGAGPGPLNHLYRLQEPVRPKNIDPAPLHEYITR